MLPFVQHALCFLSVDSLCQSGAAYWHKGMFSLFYVSSVAIHWRTDTGYCQESSAAFAVGRWSYIYDESGAAGSVRMRSRYNAVATVVSGRPTSVMSFPSSQASVHYPPSYLLEVRPIASPVNIVPSCYIIFYVFPDFTVSLYIVVLRFLYSLIDILSDSLNMI